MGRTVAVAPAVAVVVLDEHCARATRQLRALFKAPREREDVQSE